MLYSGMFASGSDPRLLVVTSRIRAFGVGIGQRLAECGINHRKDRGIHANADGDDAGYTSKWITSG